MYICRVNSSSAFKTSYLPLASTDKNKRVCVASQNITYTYVATTLYLRSKHIALAAWNNNHTMQSVPFVAANVSFLTATHTHKHKNWRHCLFLQTSALHLLAYQLFISIQKQLVVIACLEHTHAKPNQTAYTTAADKHVWTCVTLTFLYNTTKHTTNTCKFHVNCACAPKTHICNIHSFSHQLSFLRQMLILSADKQGAWLTRCCLLRHTADLMTPSVPFTWHALDKWIKQIAK